METKEFPVITLCGSTKFKKEYLKVQRELTLSGFIVISVGLFGHADKERLLYPTKKMLDAMHKSKIDLADGIYVIDVGGYIGESTKGEIAHATDNKKEIIFYSKQINRPHYSCGSCVYKGNLGDRCISCFDTGRRRPSHFSNENLNKRF